MGAEDRPDKATAPRQKPGMVMAKEVLSRVAGGQRQGLGDRLPVRGAMTLRWWGWVGQLVGLQRLARLYLETPAALDGPGFIRHSLATLGVSYEIGGAGLTAIPPQGPVIVVANHPFGALEGLILVDLLFQRRADVKILANYLLQAFRELAELLIYVDPFGRREKVPANAAALRQAVQWVRKGGLLALFPAGEVSHRSWNRWTVADPPWQPAAAGLIRQLGVPVLPIYFHGQNSQLFQLLGLLHPRLRTLLLPRELLNKQGGQVRLQIGQPIPPDRLREFPDNRQLAAYLQWRTYLLAPPVDQPRRCRMTAGRPARAREPVSPPEAPAILQAEIAALPLAQLLLTNGAQQVYYATASQIPRLLLEIGRLRELTFRQVGEGTGRCRDLDDYDNYYYHLFIWHRERRELIGAYRLGPTDLILAARGPQGLYTASLFVYGRAFLARLNPALELGRAFVRPEYQKSYAALLLLWKGIGQFVVRQPRYKILFGPVSIAPTYGYASQCLLTQFFLSQHHWPDLARLVKPRHPWRPPVIPGWSRIKDHPRCLDLEHISELVAELEGQQRDIPVLLKYYWKLGGRVLQFSRDPKFGNVLDGLLVVDLRQTPAKLLERYMGPAGAAACRAFWATL